jgi:hypothetical protein
MIKEESDGAFGFPAKGEELRIFVFQGCWAPIARPEKDTVSSIGCAFCEFALFSK